jgi:hypothetical protein
MKIEFATEELQPVIEQSVTSTFRLQEELFGNRLAVKEWEAAEMLDIHQRQLAAERPLGNIQAFRLRKAGG